MAAKTGTDVAVRDEKLALIHKAILGEAELPPVDAAAMSRAILERILESDSFEQAFTQQSLTPWRTMLGVAVVVTDVRFNRSSFNDGQGPSIYAVCDLVIQDTGEAVTVTCGGQNVLGQLLKGVERGWLIEEARPVRMIENMTSEGYGALWLEAVEAS